MARGHRGRPGECRQYRPIIRYSMSYSPKRTLDALITLYIEQDRIPEGTARSRSESSEADKTILAYKQVRARRIKEAKAGKVVSDRENAGGNATDLRMSSGLPRPLGTKRCHKKEDTLEQAGKKESA